MSDNDRAYLEGRAEMELEMAQKAEHPSAVKAHYELAGLYLDKVYGGPDSLATDGDHLTSAAVSAKS